MAATADENDLYNKARELRLAHDEVDLPSGAILVAVLKPGTKSTAQLTRTDFRWLRCPPRYNLAMVRNLYTSLDLSITCEDLVFKHDGTIVAWDCLVSTLGQRNTNFVVLEATKASEVTSELLPVKLDVRQNGSIIKPLESDAKATDEIERGTRCLHLPDSSLELQGGAMATTYSQNRLSDTPRNNSTEDNGARMYARHDNEGALLLHSACPQNPEPAKPTPRYPRSELEHGQKMDSNIPELFKCATPEQLEAAVDRGMSTLKYLKATLESRGSDSPGVPEWIESIDECHEQSAKTRTIIGVVGATGAGKSSLLNAVLGEDQLLPTNCMRACTSVVTEISYNDGAIPYRAEIEFISPEDWRKELEILLQDLLDSEGRVSRDCANQESEAGVAFAKIKAIYPKLTKDTIPSADIENLMNHPTVQCLGTVRSIEDRNCAAFASRLRHYIDSKEKTPRVKPKERKRKPREREFWPLIHVVRLYVKAPALITGAVICDLPGVHDSNQARTAIAQEYLKQCNAIWIVAPISRAVDDKSAKSLLGDTFKRQLQMDGGYDSVTFICSKTDDISIMEAARSLGLEQEVYTAQMKIEACQKNDEKLKKKLDRNKRKRRDLEATMDQADEDLEQWEQLRNNVKEESMGFDPSITPSKRKRLDEPAETRKKARRDDSISPVSQSASIDDKPPRKEMTLHEIAAKVEELKKNRTHAKEQRLKLDELANDLETQIEMNRKELETIKAEVSATCISGRNDYSREVIRQDFAAGIRELDQEIAEHKDASTFDPEHDARDYDEVARSLPVYCVSSRGYQKLLSQRVQDADVPGFNKVSETEIPQLQAHCRKLTEVGRNAASKRFLNSFSHLLSSLRLWCTGEELGQKLTERQFKELEQCLQDRLSQFDAALETTVKLICNRIVEEIQDDIFENFEPAIHAAASASGDISARWGRPVDHLDRAAGGLYWATYKAICRRNGTWRDQDFNAQLVEPLLKHIAKKWETAFQRHVPRVLAELPIMAGNLLRDLHADIETRCVIEGRSPTSFLVLQQSISTYCDTFKGAAGDARAMIKKRQRDINREFAPVITHHMLGAYTGCVAESGKGSFMRMKNLMALHVSARSSRMFAQSTEAVKTQLEKLVESIDVLLLTRAEGIYQSIKRDYERVVLGVALARGESMQAHQNMLHKVCQILDGVRGELEEVLSTVEDPAAWESAQRPNFPVNEEHAANQSDSATLEDSEASIEEEVLVTDEEDSVEGETDDELSDVDETGLKMDYQSDGSI